MGTIETDAFVLRTVKYGDADLIVTLLGRTLGKFSAIARSARKSQKRFGGNLLPMRTIRATVSFRPNSDLATLVGANVVADFRRIEESYEKITIASYATELVRECTREGEDSGAPYDLLSQFYGLIAEAEDSPNVLRILVHHMELSLLGLIGQAPSLLACHRCQAEVDTMDKLRCSRSGAGLVCADCKTEGAHYGVLSPGTLRVLQFAMSPSEHAPVEVVDATCLTQTRRVIDASLNATLDKTLKSRQFLDDVFR